MKIQDGCHFQNGRLTVHILLLAFLIGSILFMLQGPDFTQTMYGSYLDRCYNQN
jgi:hypothetical protein